MNTEQKTEKILIIADDLTGSSDTGVQFSKKHLRTIVITNKDFIIRSLKNFDVLVFDTESRSDDKKTAYNKVFETGIIAKGENILYIYKKLDSTMRGNIGAEISALLDSLSINCAIIAPALPEYGRTTRNGNVYVRGVLLSDTETANDPKTPVRESHIPTILAAQTDKKTGVIILNEVRSGEFHLAEKVEEQIHNGVQLLVIDAEERNDLDLIVSAISLVKEKVLLVGSTGLAESLPVYFNLKIEKKSNIVFAGSVSEITINQINYAIKNLPVKLIDMEPWRLFAGEEKQEKERILDLIKHASGVGEDVIIRSASSREMVSKTFNEGLKSGIDRFRVSDIIATFLGELARITIQENKINGILFTGGDIAIKAVQSLNVSGTILFNEVLPGIPYGRFAEERYKNITVVSKAGGFGNEDAVFQILNFLNNMSPI